MSGVAVDPKEGECLVADAGLGLSALLHSHLSIYSSGGRSIATFSCPVSGVNCTSIGGSEASRGADVPGERVGANGACENEQLESVERLLIES